VKAKGDGDGAVSAVTSYLLKHQGQDLVQWQSLPSMCEALGSVPSIMKNF
jgi:hypothetical protein